MTVKYLSSLLGAVRADCLIEMKEPLNFNAQKDIYQVEVNYNALQIYMAAHFSGMIVVEMKERLTDHVQKCIYQEQNCYSDFQIYMAVHALVDQNLYQVGMIEVEMKDPLTDHVQKDTYQVQKYCNDFQICMAAHFLVDQTFSAMAQKIVLCHLNSLNAYRYTSLVQIYCILLQIYTTFSFNQYYKKEIKIIAQFFKKTSSYRERKICLCLNKQLLANTFLIQIITNMFKRSVTPLTKDKPLSRNLSNNQKILKDIKNIGPAKQVLSRNPSNSKITFSNQSHSIPFQGVNPESPDQLRRRESLKSYQINEEMRKVVVEWMIQISHRANLRRETIFMGVHVFDAILEKLKNISTNNIQLIATTALFIAAKYEEIYPETLQKFLEYTANSYSKQELLLMEEKILGEMEFKLTFPTRVTHYGMMQQSNGNNDSSSSKKYNSLCLFLLELSLLVRWEEGNDAELAEAAVFLARKVLKMATGWTKDSVMEIAYRLMGAWRQNERGVLAYLYDCEKHCFVGGLKVFY